MRCVRSWLQCVSRLRSFHCHQVRSKRERISLSRRDLPVISALVAIRQTQVGLAHAPNKLTNVRRNFWPAGKAARFSGPMPGESFAVPTDDRVGLNHRETSPPAGPESVQQNPQEPVAAVEAQATRPVLLENCKLVAKREDLRL